MEKPIIGLVKEHIRHICIYFMEDEQGNCFVGESHKSLALHGELGLAKHNAIKAQQLFYQEVSKMKPSQKRAVSYTLSMKGLETQMVDIGDNRCVRAWVLSG